jgi:hypothetical protein
MRMDTVRILSYIFKGADNCPKSPPPTNLSLRVDHNCFGQNFNVIYTLVHVPLLRADL